jgi:hypothetical protein
MKHQIYYNEKILIRYTLLVLSSAFVLIIQQSFSPELSLSLLVRYYILLTLNLKDCVVSSGGGT